MDSNKKESGMKGEINANLFRTLSRKADILVKISLLTPLKVRVVTKETESGMKGRKN